ncbi:histidine phosphatase family (branch protein 1) (macronuclear) [Tetrahymena thermophila SB210]|uniref:Histidine phosphatase family (Branch protein 1) n=1 Tax=Tetrahymena thermophila (strain SB210) TaxID=312017 RepID=Q22T38_TETTS|nr:histidine phosphatase family (branch protein 1) [Tetrahymena thermophila SB210]EAR88600.1 histidine phosphatase family (branch protein 1) [Tetrahymena thermophila SB210]|eukprot:XP_001008845.1 histidine phosphatase family (branch protein 1) [Tetrahymena thermophila SB210]
MQFELLRKQVQQFVKLQNSKNVLLVRHGQSMGNYSGTVTGWTDTKLTLKGRAQANKLFQGFVGSVDKFTSINSSDLIRSLDTAYISLAFPEKSIIKVDPLLRELNFGKEEGIHFDSLSQERKDLINNIEFKAVDGESWHDTRKRAIQFFGKLPEGNHLVFTHGGLMCSLTWYLGLQNTLPNGSLVALQLDPKTNEPNKIIFDWSYPKEEEEVEL